MFCTARAWCPFRLLYSSSPLARKHKAGNTWVAGPSRNEQSSCTQGDGLPDLRRSRARKQTEPKPPRRVRCILMVKKKDLYPLLKSIKSFIEVPQSGELHPLLKSTSPLLEATDSAPDLRQSERIRSLTFLVPKELLHLQQECTR